MREVAGCLSVGIENSKSVGMVAVPAIVTEIVAEIITLAF
jgi:hypothetical protein